MKFSPLASLQHRVNVGVPLPFNVHTADKTLVLARGQIVTDFAQLAALFDRGALVDKAEVRAQAVDVMSAKPEELPRLWAECFNQVSQTLKASTEPGFASALNEACTPVLGLIARDPDLAVFQVLRQSGSVDLNYGLTHSLHAGVTSFLVAQRLGWSPSEIKRAFQAALTMNLAMVELQGVLAAQTTPPTPVQRSAIQDHPEASVGLLEAAGITDSDWLSAVAQHHETADGKGYPKGLSWPTELASLLRRADVYTSKLSARRPRGDGCGSGGACHVHARTRAPDEHGAGQRIWRLPAGLLCETQIGRIRGGGETRCLGDGSLRGRFDQRQWRAAA